MLHLLQHNTLVSSAFYLALTVLQSKSALILVKNIVWTWLLGYSRYNSLPVISMKCSIIDNQFMPLSSALWLCLSVSGLSLKGPLPAVIAAHMHKPETSYCLSDHVRPTPQMLIVSVFIWMSRGCVRGHVTHGCTACFHVVQQFIEHQAHF